MKMKSMKRQTGEEDKISGDNRVTTQREINYSKYLLKD